MPQLDALDNEPFVAAVGWVFEHSPWVAERAWPRRPFASVDALHAAMAGIVARATREEQLALLRAHPDLGARARMSDASTGEQAGAGLDRLTAARVRAAAAAQRGLSREVRLPVPLRGEGQHASTTSSGAGARAWQASPTTEFPRSAAAGLPHRAIPAGATRRYRCDQFASGWKRNYYGKGDVIVYRLQPRRADAGRHRVPCSAPTSCMLIYGDAFWPTYTTGDNTGLVATDSMKNFIQRETLNFPGDDLESYCRFLAAKFLEPIRRWKACRCPPPRFPTRGAGDGNAAFAPAGPERATARIELRRTQSSMETVEARSGIAASGCCAWAAAPFTASCATSTPRCPTSTTGRCTCGSTLDWLYTDSAAAYSDGAVTAQVRAARASDVFQAFESGSIQQIIYQIGNKILAEIPSIAEVNLEADNRTWDTVAERGERSASTPMRVRRTAASA